MEGGTSYEAFKAGIPRKRRTPETLSQKGGQDRSVTLTLAKPGVR